MLVCLFHLLLIFHLHGLHLFVSLRMCDLDNLGGLASDTLLELLVCLVQSLMLLLGIMNKLEHDLHAGGEGCFLGVELCILQTPSRLCSHGRGWSRLTQWRHLAPYRGCIALCSYCCDLALDVQECPQNWRLVMAPVYRHKVCNVGGKEGADRARIPRPAAMPA